MGLQLHLIMTPSQVVSSGILEHFSEELFSEHLFITISFFRGFCVLNRIIFTISASRSLFYQQDLTDLAEAKANNRSLLFAWKYFIYCNIYFSLFSFDRIAFCLPMVNLCFNIIKCESSVEGSDWNQIEKFPVLKVRW